VDDGTANRSRWQLHPTWATLHDDYEQVAAAEPLCEEAYAVVRGARYTGKSRLLRRLLLGVVSSLEVEDAAPASAALAELQHWADRAVAREAERAAARRAHYKATYGAVPAWVERGMGTHLERAERVRHRVQMLLGIFAARGVLPLQLKPARSVGDLVVQHLDDLEDEADAKGGVTQVLLDHFARAYKIAAPPRLFTPTAGAA
jgi:hypothetical protein